MTTGLTTDTARDHSGLKSYKNTNDSVKHPINSENLSHLTAWSHNICMQNEIRSRKSGFLKENLLSITIGVF